jgi:ssDNA thymidine ADP-ribosyltransferase, DarT
MSNGLSPEKALIFRIVHRDSVPWILDNGLHRKNSRVLDPNFVEIGNKDLISKRGKHPIVRPPGGTLSDYIPFYFTPFSPMLYNMKTGCGGIRQRNNDEIVITVSSLRTLQAENISFLFTDRYE